MRFKISSSTKVTDEQRRLESSMGTWCVGSRNWKKHFERFPRKTKRKKSYRPFGSKRRCLQECPALPNFRVFKWKSAARPCLQGNSRTLALNFFVFAFSSPRSSSCSGGRFHRRLFLKFIPWEYELAWVADLLEKPNRRQSPVRHVSILGLVEGHF